MTGWPPRWMSYKCFSKPYRPFTILICNFYQWHKTTQAESSCKPHMFLWLLLPKHLFNDGLKLLSYPTLWNLIISVTSFITFRVPHTLLHILACGGCLGMLFPRLLHQLPPYPTLTSTPLHIWIRTSMEWILVLGSVSREKKEPRSSDKVQITCPRGRKMAKASERAGGREEVGSEGTKAVKI